MDRDPVQRHLQAAARHEAAADRHAAAARFWLDHDDPEKADLEWRNERIERDAAALERDRAGVEERRREQA